MGVADHGTSGQTTAAPSLAAWATSVAAALDNSDTTVNARIAAAIAAGGGGSSSQIDDDATSELTTWSSARIVAYLAEILPSAAPAVVFTTTGSTFSPVVELVSQSAATVTWTDGTTGETLATGSTPTINFGTAATRTVRMRVTGGGGFADVTTLNLGFNSGDDSGRYNAGSGYNHAAQACSGVTGLTLLTGLRRFLAANGNLAGALDFTGLSALEFIECFGAYVTSVNLTGCTSLIRLCMEHNSLTTLDLNPVAGNLRDLRAAEQRGGAITFTALSAPMASLYHFCVRDQAITGFPTAAQLPAVNELWNWNTGQAGAFTAPANATDIRAYGNSYTALTDAGSLGSHWIIDLAGNALTSATLTTPWPNVDLSDNSLNAAAVDGVIATVNGWATSNGTLDLAGNTAPTSASDAAIAALRARGWTVAVDVAGDVTPPGPVTNLTAGTPAANTVPLSWTNPVDSDLAAIVVRYAAGSTPPATVSSGTGVTVSPATATSVTVSGLSASTGYAFAVFARDSSNNTSTAATTTATTASDAPSALWADTFDRADVVGVANLGNGWHTVVNSQEAAISSGDLVRTTGGGYGVLVTPTSLTLPADYELEITMNSASMTSYWGVVGRWSSGNGVRVLFTDNHDTITIGNAADYGAGNVSVTTVNGFPASWANSGTHTLTVRMVGSTIDIYCDGQHSHTATLATNATATGTEVGFCGEANNRHWQSIAVRAV